jgi:1-acyl-sn-glycerol-3-phosphate acyltransferase
MPAARHRGILPVTTISSLYRWSVGLLYMAVICFVLIVCSLFMPTRAYDPLFKALQRGLFKLLFIPVEVEGAEKLGNGRAALVMANHVSIFDIPLLGGFLPGVVRGVEWEPHFRWPLYGPLIRRIGNIPIDRDNAFSSMKSLQKAHKELAARHSLVILPEAHRTTDGKLRQFKRLPFHLAKTAGVELVPVGLSGLFSLKNRGSWKISSSRLKVAIGEAISAEEIGGRTVDELRHITKQRIEG